MDDLRRVEPVYETLPGWNEDISEVRHMGDLPTNARKYLERVSELVGCPVEMVSVGAIGNRRSRHVTPLNRPVDVQDRIREIGLRGQVSASRGGTEQYASRSARCGTDELGLFLASRGA